MTNGKGEERQMENVKERQMEKVKKRQIENARKRKMGKLAKKRKLEKEEETGKKRRIQEICA